MKFASPDAGGGHHHFPPLALPIWTCFPYRPAVPARRRARCRPRSPGPSFQWRRAALWACPRGCDDETCRRSLTLAIGITALTEPDLEWLHALVSDWQLLADLSFADLVLWAPLRDGSGWVALAQMRPTTGPTTFLDDVVGTCAAARGTGPSSMPRTTRGRICREGDPEWTGGVPVRRRDRSRWSAEGAVIAVIERSTNLSSARTPSRLELTYLKGADDLAQMVAAGTFPYPGQEPALVRSPRVGDGLLRLGRSGPGQLRQPERPVRLPQARPDRRPGRRRAGAADDQALLHRPARRRLAHGDRERALPA